MNIKTCKLCKRKLNDINFIFIDKYDFNENEFDNELCYVCNCYKQLTGNMKAVNDLELKKLNLIIFMIKKLNRFYQHEKMIQQKINVSKWKNDIYLKEWYKKEFEKDKKFLFFKRMLKIYFDTFQKNINGEIVWEYISDEHFINWVNDKYFVLKNKIRWY